MVMIILAKERRDMNVHLVEPSNHFVKLQDDSWESGWWDLEEDKAKKLVGGDIYFHKSRQEPSFYGGTILGYRVKPNGKHQGKIIFLLHYSSSCRNVRTDKSGWKKAVKIVNS